jgi:hypothetical protein
LLFQSQGATLFSKGLQSILGFIIELAKYTLPVCAVVGVIAGKQVHMVLRVIAFIMAIACFYYSIMATQGYQLIELKQIETDTIQQSDEYKRLQSELQSKKAQLKQANDNTTKLIELDKQSKNNSSNLTNSLNADIKTWNKELQTKNDDMQKAANSGNWGDYNNRAKEIKQLQINIANNHEQLKNIKSSDVLEVNNTNIDKLNTEITSINYKIDSMYKGKKVKSGYDILFTSQEAFNNFLMWLAVLIEFVGIYFAIIVGMKHSDYRHKPKLGFNTASPSLSQSTTVAKTKGEINNKMQIGSHNFMKLFRLSKKPETKKAGFQFQPNSQQAQDADNTQQSKPVNSTDDTSNLAQTQDCDFSNDDVIKYLDYMYTNKKGNLSPGQNKIKAHTSLSYKAIKGIRYKLEQDKIIKIDNDNNKTFVLVDTINKALKMI